MESTTTTARPYCGNCYAAAEGCCNTCAELRAAFEKKGWFMSPAELSITVQCKGEYTTLPPSTTTTTSTEEEAEEAWEGDEDTDEADSGDEEPEELPFEHVHLPPKGVDYLGLGYGIYHIVHSFTLPLIKTLIYNICGSP